MLFDPVFGRFFFGKLIATIGIWAHNILSSIIVYELTGSATAVGMVSVAQFGPQVVLAPLAGSRADVGNRRHQLILGRGLAASGSMALGIAILHFGVAALPGAWIVIGAALIVGIGFSISGPAMHALLPSLVSREELSQAVALNIVPSTLARALGPAAGALLALVSAPGLGFIGAGIANGIFALMVFSMPLSTSPAASERWTGNGLSYVLAHRTLWRSLVGVGAIGVGADPAITLTPALAQRLGSGPELVGVFASVFGVGAGLGLTVFSRRSSVAETARPAAGLLTMTIGALILALSHLLWLSVVAFLVAGIGMTAALASLTTVIQRQLAENVRGRIMALWSVAFLGSRPVAATLHGSIADFFGLSWSLLFTAIVLVVSLWMCRPSMLIQGPDVMVH